MHLTINQRFQTGKDAARHVRDYALAERKRVKSKPSGGSRKVFVCTSADAGCGFSVSVRRTKKKDESYWYVTAMCLEHTNCTSTPKPTVAQLAGTRAMVNAVTANPLIKAKAAAVELQLTTGLEAPSRTTLHRALVVVREKVQSNLVEGHRRLPSFLQLFAEKNPGSVAAHDYDQITGKFQRACLVHGGIAKAVNQCQRLLGVDGGHMKTDAFDGIQLLVVGRDGNFKNVTVAAALVASESRDDFVWFFGKLMEAGVDLTVPVFCDRALGLAAAARELHLTLMNCSIHIYRNTLLVKGFNRSHRDVFYQLQAAETEEAYNMVLEIIRMTVSHEAAAYLRAIDPASWALWPHLHTLALYGWRSSNFVESEMAATKETGLRHKNPFDYFEAIVVEIMEDTVARSALVDKWVAKGQLITEGAMKKFKTQVDVMGEYKCLPSHTDMVFVHHLGLGPPRRRRVSLRVDEPSCTCGFYFQHKIPCMHMCAALKSVGRYDGVWSYFGSEYKVASFELAFKSLRIDMPIFEELTSNAYIVPSMKTPTKPKRGPKQAKRIPSRGEGML